MNTKHYQKHQQVAGKAEEDAGRNLMKRPSSGDGTAVDLQEQVKQPAPAASVDDVEKRRGNNNGSDGELDRDQKHQLHVGKDNDKERQQTSISTGCSLNPKQADSRDRSPICSPFTSAPGIFSIQDISCPLFVDEQFRVSEMTRMGYIIFNMV